MYWGDGEGEKIKIAIFSKYAQKIPRSSLTVTEFLYIHLHHYTQLFLRMKPHLFINAMQNKNVTFCIWLFPYKCVCVSRLGFYKLWVRLVRLEAKPKLTTPTDRPRNKNKPAITSQDTHVR